MSLLPPRTLQLPDDIVEDILLRLRKTLISSSKFANEHLRRSILVDPTLSHPKIVHCSEKYKHQTIEVFPVRSVLENTPVEPTKVASIIVGERYFIIIGSCNGLLCLIPMSSKPDTTSAILWNPCTGFTCEPTPEIAGGFAYGGFGYDHTSNRYKLFMMLTDREKRERSRIYTFAPNSSWRTIPDFDFNQLGHPRNSRCPIQENNQVGVFVSGSNTLNWYVRRDGGDGIGNGGVVISLDLGKESYDILSLPERHPDDNQNAMVELSLLRNCLAVCFEHKRTHWLCGS
ncbi:hypothetical protein PIB30_006658 [Stylosanthes scabra]|uniref:F-box associated beta-propeller type 1 domain-containing protein n=1 Tax=Stylosanthes scabra TaxID=79078 RepID=A0ABU6R3A4_9FABA|nr:hypothetical protein [Stylosanthes scabra]